MYNVLTRVQNVFGFFTTVASMVAIAVAVLSLATTSTPALQPGSLTLKNVQVYVLESPCNTARAGC